MTPPAELRLKAALARLRRLGPRLNVAFSGGVDSLGLALLARRSRRAVRLLHVHHGLGSASDAMAARAAELGAALGLPLEVLHVDGDAILADPRGLEAAARQARYTALGQAAGGERVLVAHTANDALDTLVMRLLQGAGVAGMGGLRRRVRLWGARVRRPLLDVWRTDLEALVAASGLEPVVDAMNDDPRFARVRARAAAAGLATAAGNAVLGALGQLRDDRLALAAAARTALRGVRLADACRDSSASTGLGARLVLDRRALRSLAPSLARAAVRAGIGDLGVRPSRQFVHQVVRCARGPEPRVVMAHGVRCEIVRNAVLIEVVDDPQRPLEGD